MSEDVVAQQRARLARFYAHYVPTKTAKDVETALSKYTSNYEKMWSGLESKYGKEADIPAASADDGAQPAAASSSPAAAIDDAGGDNNAADAQAQAEADAAAAAAAAAEVVVVPVNVDNIRDRLRRYYAHYVPTKTEEDISTAIDMFANGNKGGYDAMFHRLEQKYGLERDIPETSSVQLADDELKLSQTLADYYKHYGINKSEVEIKTAVLRFRNGANGGYDKMWAKLFEKYGPDPSAATGGGAASGGSSGGGAAGSGSGEPVVMADPNAPREEWSAALEDPAARLRRFYDTHAPTKTDEEIKTSLSKFVGAEATATGGLSALWSKLSEKYGAMPLPPPGYPQQWARMRKYFNHYAPQTKNTEIDWMLAKACSTPTGINQLWQDLVAKHGAEPLDPEVERAMKGPTFVSARSLGDAPMSALSIIPRHDNEVFRRPKHKDQDSAQVVRVLINFAGLDWPVLEELSLDKRRRIADAMEQQLAMNSGIQAKNVSLIDVRGADAEFEMSSTLGAEHQLFHAAASVVSKTVAGSYSVRLIRDTILKEGRINALHLHAITAKVPKSTKQGTVPPISDPAAVARESNNLPPTPALTISPEEARAIQVADEVSRMTEQQRMQYSWKKTLDERLQGKNGTGLSFKRNNDAYREFMGNIWSDTAAAFSKTTSTSRLGPSSSEAK